jgi:SAM-dependent methyltransferase
MTVDGLTLRLARLFGKKRTLSLLSNTAAASRRWASSVHRTKLLVEWGLDTPPEYFDHNIDLYHQWGQSRDPFWAERGIFNILAMQPGARVLELCCGTGFNARHFYSHRAESVIAVDFSPDAIAFAKKYESAPNLEYRVGDIRTEMPLGSFDNIFWDAAIEHFTEAEINAILAAIKARLAPNGIVSGYTLAETPGARKPGETIYHEIIFEGKEDLRRFFEPHFENVTVLATQSLQRQNLHFWASDGNVPLSPPWPSLTHKSAFPDRPKN